MTDENETQGGAEFPDVVAELAARAARIPVSEGLQPEVLDLPAGLVSAVMLYVLEDGSFGAKPMVDGMSLDDVADLIDRASRRVTVTMAVNTLKAEVAEQAKAGSQRRVVVPAFGRRR